MAEKNELARFLINMLNGIDQSLCIKRTISAPYHFAENEAEKIRIEAKADLHKFDNIMDSFIEAFLNDETKIGEWIENHAEEFLDIKSLCSGALVKAYREDFKMKKQEKKDKQEIL